MASPNPNRDQYQPHSYSPNQNYSPYQNTPTNFGNFNFVDNRQHTSFPPFQGGAGISPPHDGDHHNQSNSPQNLPPPQGLPIPGQHQYSNQYQQHHHSPTYHSGFQQPSPDNLQLLQHPHHPHGAQPEAPPNFLPIFTLIEDTSSAEHFHPKVHYIFSDDEFDPITAALTATSTTITNEQTTPAHPSNPHSSSSSHTSASTDPPTNKTKSTLNPNSRAIILDLSPSLTTIKSAISLSPDWQILNVNLASAPQQLIGGSTTATAGGEDTTSTSVHTLNPSNNPTTTGPSPIPGDTTGARPTSSSAAAVDPPSLMLTIEGTSIPKDAPSSSTKKAATGSDGIYDLASAFTEKMALIKRVIDFGIVQEREKEREREQGLQQLQQREGEEGSGMDMGIGGMGELGMGMGMGMGIGMGGEGMERGYSRS